MKSLITILILTVLFCLTCLNIDSAPSTGDVVIYFTHAGDDGVVGTADHYQFRVTDDLTLPYETWPIINLNVTPREIVDPNNPPVDTLSFRHTFPDDSRWFYICAKSWDEADNVSAFCIVDSLYIDDATPPGDPIVQIVSFTRAN